MKFTTVVASAIYLILRKCGLNDTYPYRVMVCGEPLWMEGWDNVEEGGGFYTTRWVFARSEEAASDMVVSAVKKEASLFARNPATLPLKVKIEECEALTGIITRRGGGFTFWTDGESDD